jgi:hypothetical protein
MALQVEEGLAAHVADEACMEVVDAMSLPHAPRFDPLDVIELRAHVIWRPQVPQFLIGFHVLIHGVDLSRHHDAPNCRETRSPGLRAGEQA